MEQNVEANVNTQSNIHTVQPGGKRVKQGGKKGWIVLAVVLVLLVAGYLGCCAYADSLDTFYPNYSFNGVDVSGLNVEQAQARLEEALSAQQVTLTDSATGEVLTTVPLMELGYTAEDFANNAGFWMEDQQRDGFLGKGWTFLNHLLGRYPGGANWPSYDEAQNRAAIEALVEELNEEPVHAAHSLGENVLQITKAKDGREISVEALAHLLGDTAAGIYDNGYQVAVTFNVIPADTFTAQELYDTLYGEMKNAAYDTENDCILPERLGVDFSVEAAQAAINGAEPGETVSVAAVVTTPTVTAELLEAVMFRDVLGEWKTHVSGTAARINNVKLSASSINGYIMNTGDVFSYNEVVGQRTEANGYQAAPAYVKGETVDEIGGGICQTSSTLYYACLLSQVEIVERYAHRYVPAYIPWGMDATVSWGGPDYKFSNNTDYPIKIETVYSKNYLTVRVLGTKTDDTYVKMTNEVISTTPWETVYEVDETLAPGTAETVKTTPYTGYKVKAYRNLYDGDGNLISTTLESTSDYKVRNKVIVQAPAAVVQPEPAPPVEEGPVVDVPAVETVTPGQEPPEETAPAVTGPVTTPPEAAAPVDAADPAEEELA